MALLEENSQREENYDENQLELFQEPAPASITVQTVLLHPYSNSMIYWIHNVGSLNDVSRTFYGLGKPPGWGNPGGRVAQEDEIGADGLRMPEEKIILACGRRETTAETGFTCFTFLKPVDNQCYFLAYNYSRREGSENNLVYTMAAMLDDFVHIPVQEFAEVDRGMWVDLTQSPVDFFAGEQHLPYWSHLRRTVIVMQREARANGRHPCVIHPLWKLPFPIGKGDPRFPALGYTIPARMYYGELKAHIEDRANHIDLDRIYEGYRENIDNKRLEEEGFRQDGRVATRKRTPPFPHPQSDLPTNDDLRRLAAYRAQLARDEDEAEWRRFAEHS